MTKARADHRLATQFVNASAVEVSWKRGCSSCTGCKNDVVHDSDCSLQDCCTDYYPVLLNTAGKKVGKSRCSESIRKTFSVLLINQM